MRVRRERPGACISGFLWRLIAVALRTVAIPVEDIIQSLRIASKIDTHGIGSTAAGLAALARRITPRAPSGLSRHRAAAQFGVAASTVINWVRRFQKTGSVAPGKMGGHQPKAIVGEHQAFLAQRIRQGDFTLRGLVAELAERGLNVDYRSVWNFVHAEKLSFKKNRSRQRARSSRRGASARPLD
jgi:putative transposase